MRLGSVEGLHCSIETLGQKILYVSFLFHVHGVKGNILHSSLPNPHPCEKKSLSLGHTESVKQASFTPQYSIGVRSVKSTPRVLGPNPRLCHFLAANQEHP